MGAAVGARPRTSQAARPGHPRYRCKGRTSLQDPASVPSHFQTGERAAQPTTFASARATRAVGESPLPHPDQLR